MSNIQMNGPVRHSLGEALARRSGAWGWFVAFGALAILFGLAALAMTVAATIASVATIGFFFVLVGIIEIAMAFRVRTWGRFFLWALSGLFYVAAGVAAIDQPLLAAAIFTLFLGAAMIASGVVRLWGGFELGRDQPRGLVILSAVVSILLGVLIVMGWPTTSLWVLGTILGVDLIFYGVGWMSLGFFLRRHRPL